MFLLGFLAIMAWIVPDSAAKAAMSCLVTRRNFSWIGLGIGIALLGTFLVMIAIAVVKLLHLVQMADWVWVALWVGLGFFLISLVVLLVTRQKRTAS